MSQTRAEEALIEGPFDCEGEFISEKDVSVKAWISPLLIGGTNPLYCDRVQIAKGAPGEIKLRFMLLNQDVVEHSLRKGVEYSLEDKWIAVRPHSSWKAGGGATSYESLRSYVSVNDADDLIIRARADTAGVAFIIPLGASDVRWIRFRRMR